MASDTKHGRQSLRAFTLPEILVYMIVSGIIFLSVMEGFALLRNYGESRAEQMTAGRDLYDGYHRLALMLHAPDSLVMEGEGRCRVYSYGASAAELILVDSMIEARFNGTTDTLLRRVVSLQLVRAGHRGTDTLRIALKDCREDVAQIGFPLNTPRGKTIIRDISEQEKQYYYE